MAETTRTETYRGATQQDAWEAFQRDAAEASRNGWEPSHQEWGQGFLQVTYRPRPPTPPAGAPITPGRDSALPAAPAGASPPERSSARRIALGLAAGVLVLVAGIATVSYVNNRESGTLDEASRPAQGAPVRPATADLPWGGNAHTAVAESRDCADLQSWFDAADFQREVLLNRFGSDDPGYEYAFAVMGQAHDRMGAIGCYE